MNSDFFRKDQKLVFKTEFGLGYIVQGHKLRFDGKQKFSMNRVVRTKIFGWIVKFSDIDLNSRKGPKVVEEYREIETDQKEDHLSQF